MPIDIRLEAARFYDNNPDTPDDIPFYQALVPSPDCSVLELGCGTGRVTLPLVSHCGFIFGIDKSSAMLSICRDKLAAAAIPPHKACVAEGDITVFDLGRRFDFIIAPFRVLQNLETDAEVGGLFHCLHQHLAPGATCILNVFQPMYDPDTLCRKWVSQEEIFEWEAPVETLVEGGRITCSSRRSSMDPKRLVLYPELIYRTFVAGQVPEEVVLKLVMRCYYPAMFERLVQDHGFRVLNRWGGYVGEAYGQGSELVIQFGE